MTGYSVQPVTLFIATLIALVSLVKTRVKLDRISIGILALTPLICVSLFFDGNIRAFIASLFMLLNLTYAAHYVKYSNLARLALIVSIIYAIVGVIQEFIYGDFLVSLGGRGFVVQGSGRGVSSLASEPSYYAIISLVMYLLAKPRFTRFAQALLIINLLLGRNTLVLVIIAVALIFEFRKMIRPRAIIISILGLIFLFWFRDYQFIYSSRPVILFNKVQEIGFVKLISLDRSLADRLGHIIYSNFCLIPRGNSAWIEYINSRELVFTFDPLSHGRIMSWTGSFIFSFGLIGILWLYFLLSRVIKKWNFTSITFVLILINAVPIPFMLLWLPVLRDFYDNDI